MWKKTVALFSFLSLLLTFVPSNVAEAVAAIELFTVVTNEGRTSKFDPAPDAEDEVLEIRFQISEPADNIRITIEDPLERTVKSFNSTLDEDTFIWDGEYQNDIVIPGTYRVEIEVNDGGEIIRDFKEIDVEYDDSERPDIRSLDVDPVSFDPDTEDSIIEFTNEEDAELTVEVWSVSGVKLRNFEDYRGDDYDDEDEHVISWDGRNNSNVKQPVGEYFFAVTARNEFGVAFETEEVSIDNEGGSTSTSNSHIGDISFSPSNKFEPIQDEELEIRFDVKRDLDELKIFAIKGREEVELFDEDDVERETNMEIFWDGSTDDEDFAAQGTWRIEFRSRIDSSQLTASRTIEVDYNRPEITDAFVSKREFDNEEGESTFLIFRVDEDAEVDIFVYEDDREDDQLEEDFEVEADEWYAIEWDGDNYDYDEDLDLKIVAKSLGNDNVDHTDSVQIDIEEERVSSNRANVLRDSISPVITDGTDEMTIYYDLEDEADITISIHKGTNPNGDEVIELIDIDDQEDGSHSVTWNGRDEDGDRLSTGIYSYKIESRSGGKETEHGFFVVGRIGDVNADYRDDDDDDDRNRRISRQVTSINGNDVDPDVDLNSDEDCGGFSDVDSGDDFCEAVEWAEARNIFDGYSDGRFRPFRAINRAEALKVIMQATGIGPSNSSFTGFSDVPSNAWYAAYIRAAQDRGVFNGDAGRNTARPAEIISKVEVLKLALEAANAPVSNCNSFYTDVVASQWYSPYVCAADDYNLIETIGQYFNPAASISRADVAEILFEMDEAGLL